MDVQACTSLVVEVRAVQISLVDYLQVPIERALTRLGELSNLQADQLASAESIYAELADEVSFGSAKLGVEVPNITLPNPRLLDASLTIPQAKCQTVANISSSNITRAATSPLDVQHSTAGAGTHQAVKQETSHSSPLEFQQSTPDSPSPGFQQSTTAPCPQVHLQSTCTVAPGNVFSSGEKASNQTRLLHALSDIERCLALVASLHKHYDCMQLASEQKSEDIAWLRLAQTLLQLTCKRYVEPPRGQELSAKTSEAQGDKQCQMPSFNSQQSLQEMHMPEAHQGCTAQLSLQASMEESNHLSVQASFQQQIQSCPQASLEDSQGEQQHQIMLAQQMNQQRFLRKLQLDTEGLEDWPDKEERLREIRYLLVQLRKVDIDPTKPLQSKGKHVTVIINLLCYSLISCSQYNSLSSRTM